MTFKGKEITFAEAMDIVKAEPKKYAFGRIGNQLGIVINEKDDPEFDGSKWFYTKGSV